MLQAFAEEHDITVVPVAEFIEHVFFKCVYELAGTCVGFNLPFDISRIAIGHGLARKRARGAFSFLLGQGKWPRIIVRHLNSRVSLITFGRPKPSHTPRSMRRRGLKVEPHPGCFVDVRTLSSALLSDSWSLKRLAEYLGTEHQKLETTFEGPLDRSKVEYGLRDVQVTWECYQKLRDRYSAYCLSETRFNRIYSEASLGKAYLRQMSVKPWREVQPTFPPETLGAILSTYYGGRAEVHIRREIVRVLYCDFMSMYPTVCTLQGLWKFVTAKGISTRRATRQVREFLERTMLSDLQRPETWLLLATIVKVRPEDNILPLRARYGDLFEGQKALLRDQADDHRRGRRSSQFSIGLNHAQGTDGLWYTLADCLASRLLTGRVPTVLEAISFEPGPMQDGLRKIRIEGNEAFEVDPAKDDFFRRLIELRIQAKSKAKTDPKWKQSAQALKICANATSYGIYVELNVTELIENKIVAVFGTGEPFTTEVKILESEGPYFHPLLGTLITGAARLMIAIAERLAIGEGLSWAFCDTDSLALAQPDGTDDAEFLDRAEQVRSWFNKLSPYAGEEELFKIEDQNFRIGLDGKPTKELELLYCWAVSAKRYVLFNIKDGRPVIRKASAHGLGHLMSPYPEGASSGIPVSPESLKEIGVARWEHDVWYRIVDAALNGNPDSVNLKSLPGFTRPAASQCTVTTPTILRWFERYNQGKPYREQVRPFGFVLAFPARKRVLLPDGQRLSGKDSEIRAIAPYGPIETAALHAFDRETGEKVPPELLPTYAQALSRYHIHPEDKFENADYDQRGVTQRRHIQVDEIAHIGKEANRWEDLLSLGSETESEILYGSSPEDVERSKEAMRAAIRVFGVRRVAAEAGLSPALISGFSSRKKELSPATNARVRSALISLRKQTERDAATLADLERRLLNAARRKGISFRGLAQEAGIDPSNLGKVLSRKRTFSASMLNQLLRAVAEEENGPPYGGY